MHFPKLGNLPIIGDFPLILAWNRTGCFWTHVYNCLATLIRLVSSVISVNIIMYAVFSDCPYWRHDLAKKIFACDAKSACDRNDSRSCREVISSQRSVEREVSLISRVTMKPCHVSNPGALRIHCFLTSCFEETWYPVRYIAALRWMSSTDRISTVVTDVLAWRHADCGISANRWATFAQTPRISSKALASTDG
jgi:hypothetical protein